MHEGFTAGSRRIKGSQTVHLRNADLLLANDFVSCMFSFARSWGGGFGGGMAAGSPGMMGNIGGQQYPYADPQTYWLLAGSPVSSLPSLSLLAVSLYSVVCFRCLY